VIRPRRVALLLGGSIAACALAWDPLAEAADPKRVLGLVLAALAVAAWIARRAKTRATSWGARCGALFVAMSAASLLWGAPSGARDLGTMGVAVGAATIGAQVGPRFARRIARVAALAIGGATGALAMVSSHAGEGNPNWLGLLLATTLPPSLDAVLAGRRRILAGAATLAQLAGLVASHSRVGWIAAFVACGAVLSCAARRPARRRVVVIASIVAVGATAALVRVEARADVPAPLALAGRAWIWHQTARATASALPFGVGLGRFGHAYLDAQGAELARGAPPEAARRFVNATTAHDDYLQAALESGPVAALLLAWALLLGARDHARSGWYGGAGALLSCAICAVGDSPLRQPATMLVVGAVLGAPLAPRRRADGPPERSATRSLLPALAALSIAAFLLFDATRGWLATRERTLARSSEPRARMAHLARGARLDPGSGETLLDLGLARLDAGDAEGGLDALGRADRLLADTGLRIAIGGAHLALGDAPAAARAYERALAWNPGSFRARAGLAQALLAAGRVEEAEREAETARRILPGDPRIRDLLDGIREARMDK
jgi:tetratricopeptide (TPR) repeat protein